MNKISIEECIKNASQLDFCSIEQAIRWIAFNEKPIVEDEACYIYPNLLLLDDKLDNLPKYLDKKNYLSPRSKYSGAKHTLNTALVLGTLKLYFHFYDENWEFFELPTEVIRATIEYASEDGFYIHREFESWDKSPKCTFRTKNQKPYVEAYYSDLYFSFGELSSTFPSASSKDKSTVKMPAVKTGRPVKYNWESFYIAVTLKAQHPDGLPEKQAGLEAEMMQWCIDNNWEEFQRKA